MISVISDKRYFILPAIFFVLCAAAYAWTGNLLLVFVPFTLLFIYQAWQARKAVFYLLLFAIPFSVEYHFTPAFGTDLPDELLMILVGFLFLASMIYSPRIERQAIRHPLVILLLAMLAWTCVAMVFSTDPFLSFKFLLAKSWYAGAFVLAGIIVFRKKENISIAALSISVAMLIVVCITIVRHSETGFSFSTINEALFPFFRNHVNYSAMLVCIIPVLFGILFLNRKRNIRILIILSILLALFALAFSYSRGAWLALVAGIVAAWLIKKRWLLAAYVLAACLSIAAVFWLNDNGRYLRYAPQYRTTIFHPDFGEHLVATYKLKDVSTAERFYRWIAGVRMIGDNWLTGYGPNTFYANYKPYAIPVFKTWVSDNKDHSTVHNYFLLIAIEQGIPGLLFLLLLIGAMLFYAQRVYHRTRDVFYRTAAMVAGIIVSMLIVLNFLSDLIETDKVGSIFFLCIALLVTLDVQAGLQSSPDIQRVPQTISQ